MSDLVIAAIRTYVPSLVGTFGVLMVARGIELDQAALSALESFIIAFGVAVYYMVVRLIAKRYPQAEALLGATKKPVYTEPEREV